MARGPIAAATTIGSSRARTAAAARRGFDATDVRNRFVAPGPRAIASFSRTWKAMRLAAMRGEKRASASCSMRPAPRATKRARGRCGPRLGVRRCSHSAGIRVSATACPRIRFQRAEP